MIEDYKDSEIILCSNIKIDKNYDNVLDISKASLVNHLRTNSEYVGNDYSILPRNRNSLIVDCPYKTALKCNYMTFKNPDYENEYVFAFVDSVDYVSEEASQINFTLDVWHTYHDKFNIEKVFVEREHVSDDTVGLHTIPEGLDTGDFVVNNVLHDGFSGSVPVVILATTIDPALDPQSQTPMNIGGNNGGGIYNGVKSGLKYYSYNLDSTTLPEYLEGFANAGQLDAISSMFMIPRAFITPSATTDLDDKPVPEETTPINYIWAINKQTTLDGYTPLNNKLLTGDYNYLYMTNNNGANAIYKYEYFNDSESPNQATFKEHGVVCPGGSTFLNPYQYKGAIENYSEGLPGAKYPICGWQSDVYTNWLTQNALSIKLGVWGSTAQIIGGLGTGMLGGSSEGYSMAAGGVNSILHQMVDWKQKQLIPNQAEGNTNTGDVLFSMNKSCYSAYKMTIKYEYAVILDRFLSRYGYKVNDVKTPTLHNRTQFDFIKVGGSDNLISGKIPSKYLDEINAICRRGVTIFHNLTNFGNYTISNPIVTP